MTLKSMTMARLVSFLGVFVCCGFIAIAMAGTQQPEHVDVHENEMSVSSENCHIEEVLLDEGYGVSRKEQRRICKPNLSARGENCRMEEVMLDEGYGVSRKEERRVCTSAD